jgi:hypothetical protein
VKLKKPWASSGWLVLTHRVPGCVDLDRPPLGTPSVVFLVARDVGARDGHVGPEAPRASEAEESLSSYVTPHV